MRTEVIHASDIDKAAERILEDLKKDDVGKVIYFDGWDGLGASVVLRRVVGLLTSTAKAEESVFHIDCSKWESRRAMQRMIASQLNLPGSVMKMFHAQDEEDDYQGIGKGSRSEIPQVAEAIQQHILGFRGFSLIFHNGSSDEIDLESIGFPLSVRYLRAKVLWSFQGRFRLYPWTKVDRALNSMRKTDVVLSGERVHDYSYYAKLEAADVAHEIITIGSSIDLPAAATSCFFYMNKLCGMGNQFHDYDLATHGRNYWACDGVIQLLQGNVETGDGSDTLWQSVDALQREMQLDEENYRNPCFQSPVVKRLPEPISYWTSPTYGFILISDDPYGQIPKGMFQQYYKLHVLKLSACKFSFKSPPFLCCHNLRFLWLDHCRNTGNDADEVAKEEDIARFSQRLWVLDVRYSQGAFLFEGMLDLMTQLRELNVTGEDDEWLDVDLLQRRMHKIRRLRVIESGCHSHGRDEAIISGMDKMELLELSRCGDYWLPLYVESSCSSLETVIINGPTDLESISFRGCAKLKNIFLSGLFPYLKTINITGVAAETLDLSAVMAPILNELLLPEYWKLCAILWPPAAEGRRKQYLDKFHIDTTQKEVTTTMGERHTAGRPPNEFDWHISIRDARILRSLEPVKDYFGSNNAHLEISSPTLPYADAGSSNDDGMKSSSEQQVQVKLKQLKDTAIYADVAVTFKGTSMQRGQQANEGDSDTPAIISICPPSPSMPSQGCYIYVEDHQTRVKLQTASITIPAFICDSAKILHVHDSLHITSIVGAPLLASATWNQLEWCRVEGCPNIECVFSPQLGPERSDIKTSMFKKLRTAWVSDLPNARYIWNWTGSSSADWYHGKTFAGLTLLHLDCCPNLIYIVHFPTVNVAFDRLERLEIMWCGDLSVAFHLYRDQTVWTFLKLKHIYLHELPKLHNIGNIGSRISMLKLETIKIRGCWSLRKLPFAICGNVKCDCEKEWWDRLEWESAEHASQYKPIHPRYYKKTMLRGSVLR